MVRADPGGGGKKERGKGKKKEKKRKKKKKLISLFLTRPPFRLRDREEGEKEGGKKRSVIPSNARGSYRAGGR